MTRQFDLVVHLLCPIPASSNAYHCVILLHRVRENGKRMPLPLRYPRTHDVHIRGLGAAKSLRILKLHLNNEKRTSETLAATAQQLQIKKILTATPFFP